MSFAVGFLIGSLLLLVGVLYFTRVRGSMVPQATAVQSGDTATSDADSDHDVRDSPTEPTPTRETCELCNEERVCREVSGMTVCSSCESDLL